MIGTAWAAKLLAAVLASAAALPDPLPPLPLDYPADGPLAAGAPAIPLPLPPAHPGDDRPARPTVLARFEIPRGAEIVLVPVAVEGKERLFALDTGCGNTVVDCRLLKGHPIAIIRGVTPGGTVDVPQFLAPAASVGPLGFHGVSTVAGADLGPLRAACGRPVEGLLGMDFLGRYVVRIDFDKGEVLFLSSAARAGGRRVPLLWDGGQVPKVRASVRGVGPVSFSLDTGCLGRHSGELDPATFERLKARGHLRSGAASDTFTLAGPGTTRFGQGSLLRVGGFPVEGPVFGKSAYPILGLGFLSRFAVTFDFPNGVVYLRPGSGAARADEFDDGNRAVAPYAVARAAHRLGAGLADCAHSRSAAHDVLRRAAEAAEAAAGAVESARRITVRLRRVERGQELTLGLRP